MSPGVHCTHAPYARTVLPGASRAGRLSVGGGGGGGGSGDGGVGGARAYAPHVKRRPVRRWPKAFPPRWRRCRRRSRRWRRCCRCRRRLTIGDSPGSAAASFSPSPLGHNTAVHLLRVPPCHRVRARRPGWLYARARSVYSKLLSEPLPPLPPLPPPPPPKRRLRRVRSPPPQSRWRHAPALTRDGVPRRRTRVHSTQWNVVDVARARVSLLSVRVSSSR